MGYKRKTDPAVALEVERKLALAVAYYKSHTKSFRDVAIHFGVNKDTLYRRVKGTHKSYAESHASSQRLSTASEAALEQRIHEACDEGFPPTLKQVKEWAQKLVDEEYEKAKKEGKVPRFSHADKLGVNWHFQFLGRHPEFRTRIQREMEKTQSADESGTVGVLGEQTTTAGVSEENTMTSATTIATTTSMTTPMMSTATTDDNDEVIAGLAAFVRSLPPCNESRPHTDT